MHLQAGDTVLEVGCGEGHVALDLKRRGFRVLAIDSEPDAIAQARDRGVDASLATWPDFECDPVDAIAFTRSLHHISPLNDAVARAKSLLRPGGRLLLEDFAFDAIDERTIRWLLDLLNSGETNSLLVPARDEFITGLLAADNSLAAWHSDHDHDLHSWEEITRAVAAEFEIESTRHVAYLYRYLIPVLPENAEAKRFVDKLYREESRLGEKRDILLIGRRMVAARN